MAEHRYHFVSHWAAAAPADAAYAALYEVVRHPVWWPEVKEARKLDEDHLWLRTRSVLPYDLAFMLDRTTADPWRTSSRPSCGAISKAGSAGRSRPPVTAAASPSTRMSSRTRRR